MNNLTAKPGAMVLIAFAAICFTSCRKKQDLPVVTTVAVTAITSSGATAGGNVTYDGGSEVTARGVCWTVSEDPEVTDNITVDGAGTGSFTSSILHLDPYKRYFVRAYATNSSGTAYGNQVKFVTRSANNINYMPGVAYDTVYDIEGHAYKTVKISLKKGAGAIVSPADDKALDDHWFADNLNVTTFNDGRPITVIVDDMAWSRTWVNKTPAACWFLDNGTYRTIKGYGVLYNWYAVKDGHLCPENWHVATRTDWENLVEALGGWDVTGGKLKETGITHWNSPNTGATNSSGLTALPGGYRADNGLYFNSESMAVFYSSSPSDANGTYAFAARSDDSKFHFYEVSEGNTTEGYSVRCVKNR